MADGIGASLGRMTGIPGAGYIGAIFGHNVVKPMISQIMPTIIKPLLESASSGEGLKAAFDTINAIAKGNNIASTAVKNLFEDTSATALNHLLPDKDRLAKLDQHMEDLKETPQAMLDIGGKMGHYMPSHATSLAATAQNAVNYLSSQKPQPNQMGPLDAPIAPSSAQMAAYNRSLQIAEQPLSILARVKQGTLLPKDVQDLKILYPHLHPQLIQRVNGAMINHMSKQGVIPFKMRAGLSMLMGQPLDSTFTPQAIMAAQSTYIPLNQPQQGQGAPRAKKGTAKVGKSAELAETPQESRQEALLKA